MLPMRHVGYAKMDSISCVSKISFRLRQEFEIITVLDVKFHCLGEVCIKCCGFKGRENEIAFGGGSDI